ncbi:carboxypeptidase A4-like isoform X1 [Cervus canadensis]|uniref:carboxypeptidase A4-like isoform X1 n=1 Tax=Cervus canadensis TaxID=1574408 RepID=UPI001C9E492F|nr:carboxypeptidase A4-like isoform X1 [Cervus canadensis]
MFFCFCQNISLSSAREGGHTPGSKPGSKPASELHKLLCCGLQIRHQVFRINVRNGDEISKLNRLVNSDNLKLNLWKSSPAFGHPADVLVPSVSLQEVKSFLEDHGLEYSVAVEDLQTVLDTEEQQMQHNVHQELSSNCFNYGAYHTLEAIHKEMDNIVKYYPHLASTVTIGHSFENRSMYVLKFSTGKGRQRPAIWLNAGIHAREWISPATAIWTARKLACDYGKDSVITSILKKMDIFVLPVANPDGYVYTHAHNRLWRKTRSVNPGSTCIGTDPNRNWNSSFGEVGSAADPCSEIYHGPHPHSEVEVKSVADFIKKHGNFKCFIDLHSYSQMVLYPYGYTATRAQDADELDMVAKNTAKALATLSGTQYRVGSIFSIIYASSGSTIDWAYDNGIKYAFSFELRDTGDYGFALPASQIIPTAQETWLGLKTIMEHVRDNI